MADTLTGLSSAMATLHKLLDLFASNLYHDCAKQGSLLGLSPMTLNDTYVAQHAGKH